MCMYFETSSTHVMRNNYYNYIYKNIKCNILKIFSNISSSNILKILVVVFSNISSSNILKIFNNISSSIILKIKYLKLLNCIMYLKIYSLTYNAAIRSYVK